MKNKANFADGEMSLSSLKTTYYENFVPFVAEKKQSQSAGFQTEIRNFPKGWFSHENRNSKFMPQVQY
jgi:hypothetical protein